MPLAEPPLLEAHGLERRFGPSAVLRGLDLSVHPGEILLVLGENGSGKTTLLRLLAGLLRPSRGHVTLEGHRLNPANVALRRRVGLLSHQSHMYDELSLRENLEFAGRLYGLSDPSTSATRAIAGAGLEQRADDRLGRLSRGMLQRAAIARAFIHEPRVMLLDEPFTALDAPSADRVRAWLTRRATGQSAIIMVTHQPAQVWDLATHVGVIAAGRWAMVEPRPSGFEAFERRYREAIRV
ncbi:MAG: heme ABC exporter ATP-binding protein CcmA [Gemmatimonadota bacterium]